MPPTPECYVLIHENRINGDHQEISERTKMLEFLIASSRNAIELIKKLIEESVPFDEVRGVGFIPTEQEISIHYDEKPGMENDQICIPVPLQQGVWIRGNGDYVEDPHVLNDYNNAIMGARTGIEALAQMCKSDYPRTGYFVKYEPPEKRKRPTKYKFFPNEAKQVQETFSQPSAS